MSELIISLHGHQGGRGDGGHGRRLRGQKEQQQGCRICWHSRSMTHIWQPCYVQAAVEMMSDELDETLFIVTSDHSHTMSFAGYPARGTDIRDPP